MGIKSFSLAATALVLSTNVNASIISTDWQTVGDNLITHDTVSGLDWLDLTETNNLSYNAVVSELGAGGVYEGFRVATSAEVVALWSNFGIDLSAGAPRFVGGYHDPSIQTAASVLGNIVYEYNTIFPHGVLGYVLATEQLTYQIGAFQDPSDTYYNTVSPNNNSTNLTQSFEFAGTYLVSAVPVPAAVWLFGYGLIGLVGLARRNSYLTSGRK